MEKVYAVLALFSLVYILLFFTHIDFLIGILGKDLTKLLFIACGGYLIGRTIYNWYTRPGRMIRILAIGEIFRLLR